MKFKKNKKKLCHGDTVVKDEERLVLIKEEIVAVETS